MEIIVSFTQFVLHLDHYLIEVVRDYGPWTLALLFAIVFLETGLVVTPFLPGDSLLFAAGAVAAAGSLEPGWLFGALASAAILGDAVNYWIGARLGPAAFSGRIRWLNQEHLQRTRSFYEKHGAKTVVLARFVPVVRTFAPFVAGIGSMRYVRFAVYNVAGALLWCTTLLGGGYYFGNLPIIRQNFSFVVLGIIAISLVPLALEWLKARRTTVSEVNS